MSTSLSSLSTILAASKPFAVTGADTIDTPVEEVSHILKPNILNQTAVDVSYTFYPPAKISLLVSETAAALLEAQADTG